MDFLKEMVSDKRTGASISPIQVDTQSRYLMNPANANLIAVPRAEKIPEARSMFLDTLEKLAKEAEELAIKNEKKKVDVELEKLDSAFKEKWAEVHDKYSNDERYKEYLKDYEEHRRQGEKIIANSNYYTDDEKMLMVEEYKVRGQNRRAEIKGERNKVYIAQQVQSANALIDQYTNIAGNFNLYEDERAKETYKKISELYKDLGKFQGTNPQALSEMLSDTIGKSESMRLSNHLATVLNSDLSISEKKAEIKKIQNHLNRDEVLNAQINELLDVIQPENREVAREDLKIALKGHTLKAFKLVEQQLKNLEKEERARNNFIKEQQALTELQNEKAYEEDLFQKNALNVASYIDNKKGYRNISLNEFLNNPSHLERISEYGWNEYGNKSNLNTLKIVPNGAINTLKWELQNNLNNGNLSTEEIYKPIYELADQISNGNEMVRNNVLKDIGLQIKIDPTIIINGEKNANYYKVASNMNKGKLFVDEFEIDSSTLKNIFDKPKFKQKFEQISNKFSSDKAQGDYMALQYVTGEVLKTNKKIDVASDFEMKIKFYLNENEINYKNIEIASEFSTKRKDYKYSNLKDVRKKANQETQIKETKKSNVLTNQATALGG